MSNCHLRWDVKMSYLNINLNDNKNIYYEIESEVIEESVVLIYGIKPEYLNKLSKIKFNNKIYYFKCQFEDVKLKKNLDLVIKYLEEKNEKPSIWLKDFALKINDNTTEKEIEELYYRIVNPYGDYF